MKTLFSKLLAFALICAVACNVVGCKNYDDEINAVNDRIDQLEGTVALKTDLQALEATVTAIENSYVSKTELAEALKAYAKPADIAAAVANAEKAMDEALKEIEDAILALQTASSKHQTAEQVAATVENMLNSYKIWADTEAYIEAQISAIVTGLTEAEVKALLAEYVKTADLHEAILGWAGDELEAFLTAEDVESMIAEADNSEALKAAILEAMTGEEGAVTVEVSKLNSAIEALAERVEALEGMIQSIVWVPTVYEQVSSGIVMFAGASYVEMVKETAQDEVQPTTVETQKFYVAPSTKTLKFKVTPAAAAKDIKKENVTIDMQEVTRTEAELFSVVSVEGDDKGILSVEVACNDFVAATEMENMPIISLNVNYGKANCASNYIGVIVAGESEAVVKYGTKNAETNVITGIGTPNAEGINIIEGQYVYYNDEPVASMPAATAYINGEELPEGWTVKIEKATVTNIPDDDTTTYTNELAENGGYYVLGPNGQTSVIGEELVGVYCVSIENGEYSYFVGQYNKTLKVHKYPAPSSLKTVDTVYALEAIFNGENYSFFDEDVTYSKVKAALWEANKEIFEPYGYTADSFLNRATSNPVLKAESLSISSDNTYGLELVLDTDGDTFGVECPDTAEGKAWAGKDAQNFTLKYKSEANCSVNEAGECESVEEAIEITFTAKLTMPTVTLDPNEYYVVDGIATAYAEWDTSNKKYVVVDKDLGPAYEWICETAAADEIVLVYSIAEDLTDFQGTEPAINPATNKLSWNDWAGLSIDVKVAAYYASNPETELASEVFSVEIASPVGALTAENKTVASANPTNVTFAELFKAVMAGTNADTSIDVLEDENAAYFAAIGGAIEYTVEIPEDATMIVTETADGIEFVNPALHLTKDIEIKVTAKFTNRFTEEQTATATVTLTK